MMKSKLINAVLGIMIGSAFGMAHIRAAETQTPWYEELKPVDTVVSEVEVQPIAEPVEIAIPCEDYEVFAALIMAEAGNQDEYGKRLVADVVLNRVMRPEFPNTIFGVIYQKYQFSVAWNGELQKYLDGRKEVSEECYKVVREELFDQVDYDIVFFNCFGYPQYGTPAYKYGDHYFTRW